MKNDWIVEVKDVSFSYGNTLVLDKVRLRIQKGDFLGLVGPNGSGKSTLLKCVLGLLSPSSGEINVFGTQVQKSKESYKIGFVSQKANSFNTGFPATVFEVVASGLTAKLGMFHFLSKQDKIVVNKSIEAVGMMECVHKNIGDLSGGQQQRVFIARALVANPEFLILDEPTVGVDAQNVKSFYQMLEDLNKNLGLTLLLVTHDIGTITDKVTHVACLNKKLHFHGIAEDFLTLDEDELSNFYGYSVQKINHNH